MKIQIQTLIIWTEEDIIATLHARTIAGLNALAINHELWETILEDCFQLEASYSPIGETAVEHAVTMFNSNPNEFQFKLKLITEQNMSY